MGNQIVIPASKDWWSSILNSKNYYVKEQIQSGSLFLKFVCTDNSKRDKFFVKAYQNERLSSIPNYKEIKKYFEILSKSDVPMIYYSDIIENSNSAFLIRRKFGQSLSDAVLQEPSLYTEEKFWVTYQLFLALKSLHTINIFHGDLKPNNIIYVPSGRVYIVDPAPFKPFIIDQYHPHYFYYFFANDSSSGCYLAPERLLGMASLKPTPQPKFPVEDLILADYFSLGCIIAFMYLNGENLFNSDTARKYGKGEYKEELENTLSAINDKSIISLIRGLISHSPRKRKDTFDNFLQKGFPSDFKSMNEKFYPKQDYFILNQKPNSNIIDYSAISSNPKAIFKDFPAIIEESTLLKQNPVTIGMRAVYFNYFSYRALKAKSLSEVLFIIDFIINFTDDFDDEAKLMRLVPLLIQLLDIEVCSLRRKLLLQLVQVFRKIQQIPNDLKNILTDSILPLFRKKFKREGINLSLSLSQSFASDAEIDLSALQAEQSNNNNSLLISEFNGVDTSSSFYLTNQSTDSYYIIIAEFLPLFSYEIMRLQPDKNKKCISEFSFLPKNNIAVFTVFAKSMSKILKNGSFFFYQDFSMYIRNFFFSGIDFKIIYMKLIIDIYKHAKDEEKPYFVDDLTDILPMIFDSICPCNKVNFTFADPGIPGAINSIDNTMIHTMSKSRPGLPAQWDGPECLKWEEFTVLSLEFFVLLLERKFLDRRFTYAVAGIVVPLLGSKSDKVYALLAVLNRYFTPYAKQMPLFVFINARIESFSGKSKEALNAPDAIKLQERSKFASSDRIKFANPLLTVPLVKKFKNLQLAPRFIQSRRLECEPVTSIAIDKEICAYVLSGKKIRFFRNAYGMLPSTDSGMHISLADERVNELITHRSKGVSPTGEKEKKKRHDGPIIRIDLLSHIDNCCFTQNLAVAYEGGRIDCIDMNKEYIMYTNMQADPSRHQTLLSMSDFQPLNALSPSMLPPSSSTLRTNSKIRSRNMTSTDGQSWKRNVNLTPGNKHVAQTAQLSYENKADVMTSFAALKKRCCLISGRWNGCIEVLDIRAAPSESGEGCFGFVGGGSTSIPFMFNGLVSLAVSPVNDDFLYAGFDSGVVTAIDLRVGLPVAESLTIPAFDIWPVASYDGMKSSCVAVYDKQSTVQFVAEPGNVTMQTVYGRSFVGTTFNGGVVLADDFSASYIDVVNKEDNVRLYDGAMLQINKLKTSKERLLSFPDIDDGEIVFPDLDGTSEVSSNVSNNYSSLSTSGMSGIGDEIVDSYDVIERQTRKSVSSVHMHKSPIKCISKFENLFASGDSTGFVNLWTICSSEASKIIPTYT